MIATVISADMDAVAQSAAGRQDALRGVTLEDALAARAERRRRLEQVREATSTVTTGAAVVGGLDVTAVRAHEPRAIARPRPAPPPARALSPR
jgi:allophanate hydrolase subunit 2